MLDEAGAFPAAARRGYAARGGQRGEPGHGKRMQDGQQEDGRGDEVERILRSPLRKRREQPVREAEGTPIAASAGAWPVGTLRHGLH